MTQFAFVFPGQGSQTVGMLSEMAANYPVIEETFREASDALGYDLWALTQQGPAEELNKTWQTQPALLTASVALWRVWQQQGGKAPALLAGHSLGEYSALVCAGVIAFADAVRLVELRGKFMQEAVPEGTGGMSAIIGLDDALLQKRVKSLLKGRLFLRLTSTRRARWLSPVIKKRLNVRVLPVKLLARNVRCRCRSACRLTVR
jgi:[acyl-carrier-protein] S-malonyltransferase